jgi:uncharacterized protein DUF2505
MKYTIEDTFDVSPKQFWEAFFDEEFNRMLFATLEVRCEPISFKQVGRDDDRVISMEQKLTPQRELPSLVQPFVKGEFSYIERSVFTARTNSMEITTIPSFMAEKIDTHGTYRLEVLGENKVNRVWDGVAICSIFLVGGRVEAMLVEEVRESYRKATQFMREWFAAHAETERIG